MAVVSDANPMPQNPNDALNNDEDNSESMPMQAILGPVVYVRRPPGSVLEEPMDESSNVNGSSDTESVADNNTYYSEIERLRTYRNWENVYHVNPAELAKDGFIYIGPSDRVTCVFCHQAIKDWSPDDHGNIRRKHTRIYPNCPIVLGHCQDLNKPILDLSQQLNVHSRGVPIVQVPIYANENLRLQSYKNWPSTNCQIPQKLAAAGFFYKPAAGKPDRVKCFMCGKVVHAWKPEDDPLREHERLSAQCDYVRTKKQESINMATPAMISTPVTTAVTEENLSAIAPEVNVPPSNSEKEEEILEQASVRAVLEVYSDDYSVKQVVQAFKEFNLIKGADQEVTAQNLLSRLNPASN